MNKSSRSPPSGVAIALLRGHGESPGHFAKFRLAGAEPTFFEWVISLSLC
jgi:hypothetical protein